LYESTYSFLAMSWLFNCICWREKGVLNTEEESLLDDVFNSFLTCTSIFEFRDVLRHDYVPAHLPHRDNEIRRLGMIVAPLLKMERCSNVFVYGKTGTGKTAAIRHVLSYLTSKAAELGAPVKAAYVNCRMAGTEYRVLSHLCSELGFDVPFTGPAVGEVFERFKNRLEKLRISLIIALDEIDELIATRGNVLLYELTRINEFLRDSKASIVGVSNSLQFKEMLEPRVLSCLNEEEIVFKPYDASELQDILWERADKAFRKGTLLEGAISLCAALAAAEHGDARRALDLLRVAGEVAERGNSRSVTEAHIREAERRIEHDRIINALTNLTPQSKLVLYSVYLLRKTNIHSAITGDICEVYHEICHEIGVSPLTQRRVSGLINELDAIGLLNARVVSRGRYGRTRKISLAIPRSPFKEAYARDEYLAPLAGFVPDCLGTRSRFSGS
jgi:cell division control protein 6